MDSYKHSTKVERLEVIETGRRRRWSDDEKLRIVMESLQTPRAISSTARRHGISRSLLVTWRRSFHPKPTGPEVQQAGFVPAMVVTAGETAPTMDAAPANCTGNRNAAIEELGSGLREEGRRPYFVPYGSHQ